MKTVIVRYAEIALKSKPVRAMFERLLVRNIEAALRGTDFKIKRVGGRIFVETEKSKKVSKILTNIPGVVSTSPAVRVAAEMDGMTSEAVRVAKKSIGAGETFAVRTSREGTHDFSSHDVNEHVGREILSKVKGLKVNLSAPDHMISIDIRGGDAYVFGETMKGVGGLPVGSQGSVLVVFSGKKRDMNAAFLMMKRGCATKFLVEEADFKKAANQTRKILKHYPRFDLFGLRFREVKKSMHGVGPNMKFLLYRRAILQAAEIVARKVGAGAVVFGDGIEILRDQGLDNLRLIDGAAKVLVLRPLIGTDMAELAAASRESRGSKAAPADEKEIKELEQKLISKESIVRAANNVKKMEVRV